MTSSLIGDVSSHCLGRSSGRPFVYGPSLACPQRVSQVSMGTRVCFLANASINPQTGSGNLGPGEWSEAYQIGPKPNTVHLGMRKAYAVGRVFRGRLRWLVFLQAFRLASV